MRSILISNSLPLAETALGVLCLLCVWLRGLGATYKWLCFLLFARASIASIALPLYMYAGHGIEGHLAYRMYFYVYWSGFAIESILSLFVIYSVFGLAMAPLGSLKRLGTVVFYWAAIVSLLVAGSSVMAPHQSGSSFIVNFISEIQRTQSIITLGLLLFVCFAGRPMGIRPSSRVFGVASGLGVLALSNLISSAWLSHVHGMLTIINTVTGMVTCGVLVMWIGYFALPEPKRRMVVLPTTSPFLRWNQIASVLGDAPGYVAIGGVPPEVFAPAELEVMRRASLKMTMSAAGGALKRTQTA